MQDNIKQSLCFPKMSKSHLATFLSAKFLNINVQVCIFALNTKLLHGL